MKSIFYKGLKDSVLDVDITSRKVKNALNRVNVKDSDDDIVEKSAFDRTIKERGPEGANLIWHLTDHKADFEHVVGKFSELYMENEYLVGVTEIPNTRLGNDLFALYEAGAINQHSIGFTTLQKEDVGAKGNDGAYTLIRELKLYEASTVLWGANSDTPNLSVGKSLTKEEQGAALLKELESLDGLLRKGKVSDETFSLLEIRVKSIYKELCELISALSIQPDVKSVEPEDYTIEFAEAIKQFTNNKK